jgi:hypothetical protein
MHTKPQYLLKLARSAKKTQVVHAAKQSKE